MTAPIITTPELHGLLDRVRAEGGPLLRYQLAARFGEPEEADRIRDAVADSPLIGGALQTQQADGSWGSADDPHKRVLPTLWMAKCLVELGLDDRHTGWHRAVEFLGAVSHTDHGVLGLDGRDSSVLSCYAGIAGETYLLGGRPDLARPQIEWILRYQAVSTSGTDRRPEPAEHWDDRLRTRYGGCLADTTCLIGLVKTGRALAAWRTVEMDPRVDALLESIREVYLERRLMYRSNGEIVPIGVSSGDPARWLLPTYPLDWHTDLIEVLDFVAGSGPLDTRMQPAIDRLAAGRLPDGSWPLRLSYRPTYLPAPERRSRRVGSPMITLRVASALAACGAEPS